MRALLEIVLAFLNRLFGKKSPIGFDRELGSWHEPDVYLSPSPSATPPPRPLRNTDCRKSFVVYSVSLKLVERCDFKAQADAMSEALGEAAAYFNDHFRCDDPDCIQKVGDIIWSGVSCGTDPTTVTAAVLVRFRCTVQS